MNTKLIIVMTRVFTCWFSYRVTTSKDSAYEHSNGLNSAPKDSRNQSKVKDKDGRLPNGLGRASTKPTNLVIPSINPSQSTGLKVR